MENYKSNQKMGLCPSKKIINIMKLSCVFLVVCLLQVYATGFTQNTVIQTDNNTLEQLHEEIENTVLQVISISGTVTDANNDLLPGVSVMIKGTTQGTATDANGVFTLQVQNENAILVFSYIGFLSQEITVGNRRTINITMNEDTQQIDEVVVIGYGAVRKRDVTGSITQVSSEDILKSNSPNLSNALQGKIPAEVGASWRPGASPNIEIRGISSITGSNSPLWVVDGIPMQSTNVSLNPYDVVSIDILKDASASAIYGARGSNGVIIVTTKRAEPGEMSIKTNYSGWFGFDKVMRWPALMSADEYVDYKRTAWKNAGRDYSDEAIFDAVELASLNAGTSTDWLKEVWGKTAFSTHHNVTISASGNKVGSMISIGYLNQESLIESAGYQRYNINFNNTFNLSDRVKFTTAILGSYSVNNDFHAFVRHAYYLSPLGTPRDENGELKLYANPNEPLVTNPLKEDANNKNTTYQYGFIGSAALEWKIWDELQYKFSAGIDLTSADNGRYYGSETRNRIESGGAHAASYQSSTRRSNVIDNILSYNKTVNHNHRLGIMAAFNMEMYQSKSVYLEATDMYFDGLYYNLESASTILNKNTNLSEWGIMSFMGRVNYSFHDRYLLTLTYRYDGSSRLAEQNKWAGFPSMSVAWRLSEESFLESMKEKFLDNLKLRLSWGNTGNTNVNAYGTLGSLSKTYYSWGEQPAIGTIPSSIPNPSLKWEKLEEYNLGIDFDIYRSRLSGSIDLYNRTTRDLILSRNLPATSGYTSVTQNIGSTRNRGIELMLKGDVIRKNDFRWNIGLTFFKNKNEILDLYGDKKDDVGSNRFIGYPIRVYYRLIFDGVWQENEAEQAAVYNTRPGYPKYRDVYNPEGTPPRINVNDDRVIINRDPKWIGGLNTTLIYKGFDFYMHFNARQGVKLASDVHTIHNSDPGRYIGFSANWWTPENKSNTDPAPYIAGTYSDIGNSDYFIKDVSFVRLSNITFGYTLPRNLINSLKMERAKVYINISNPYVWSKYKGQDPQATDREDYLAAMNCQIGINLNF